eukprot:10401672-Alexandrium_andersonii.AAC.1
MSASLVGSEMCIRDRTPLGRSRIRGAPKAGRRTPETTLCACEDLLSCFRQFKAAPGTLKYRREVSCLLTRWPNTPATTYTPLETARHRLGQYQAASELHEAVLDVSRPT